MPKMPERERARVARLEVQALQSIAEDVLSERVHAAKNDGTAVIIIKPAAFTHTTVALRNAVAPAGKA